MDFGEQHLWEAPKVLWWNSYWLVIYCISPKQLKRQPSSQSHLSYYFAITRQSQMLKRLWTLGDNFPDKPLRVLAEFKASGEFLITQTDEKAINFTVLPLDHFAITRLQMLQTPWILDDNTPDKPLGCWGWIQTFWWVLVSIPNSWKGNQVHCLTSHIILQLLGGFRCSLRQHPRRASNVLLLNSKLWVLVSFPNSWKGNQYHSLISHITLLLLGRLWCSKCYGFLRTTPLMSP